MTDKDDTATREGGQGWVVSYDNDTGPNDDYFHEWDTVGPLELGVQVHDYDNPRRAKTSRRIAAAWNACEGISTEALEDRVVSDMLEALRALVTANNSTDGMAMGRAWGNARAAIQKATGGAA